MASSLFCILCARPSHARVKVFVSAVEGSARESSCSVNINNVCLSESMVGSVRPSVRLSEAF
jgi:hypothetical protein